MTKQYLSKEEYRERLLKIIKSVDDTTIKDFEKMIECPENYGKHTTNPDEISFEIKDTGEKAFQRAILLNGKTTLEDNMSIDWIDGELPVVFNKNSKRRCPDLLGYLEDIPVICELKFVVPDTSSKSDSPIYAVIELLTYYCFIQYNVDALVEQKVGHTNRELYRWEDITKKNPLLLVCANESYWKKWLNTKNNYQDNLFKYISQWSKELGININLFQTDDFDFKRQKGDRERYAPDLYGKNKLEKLC